MIIRLSSWKEVGEGESEVNVGGWVTNHVHLVILVIYIGWTVDLVIQMYAWLVNIRWNYVVALYNHFY